MSIFIDSANMNDIESALLIGYVKGVTTNPLLMDKEKCDWRERLVEICEVCPGPVYYQIDTTNPDAFLHAAHEIYCMRPEKIVIKIPASPEYFKLSAKLGAEIPFCVTAVYSEAQVMASAESGAKHIAVYVNRISRMCAEKEMTQDGISAIESMRTLIEKQNLDIRILAASLKSPEETTDALKAGAHDATTTLDVLKAMAVHDASNTAIRDFEKAIENQ